MSERKNKKIGGDRYDFHNAGTGYAGYTENGNFRAEDADSGKALPVNPGGGSLYRDWAQPPGTDGERTKLSICGVCRTEKTDPEERSGKIY